MVEIILFVVFVIVFIFCGVVYAEKSAEKAKKESIHRPAEEYLKHL